MINNKIDFDIDFEDIEKRKERIRKTWDYRRVDHIPIGIFVIDNKECFTMKEIVMEKDKNLRFDLNSIKKSLRVLPDDYIPWIRPETGNITLATILGSEVYYGNYVDDMPRVKEPIITKIKDLEKVDIPLNKNEISKRGLMSLNLEKINYYLKITKGVIGITGIDLGNAMIGALAAMDASLFYMSLIDEEEKMLKFINRIGDMHLQTLNIITEEIGDINKMTSIDWQMFWLPREYRGFLSADCCANYGVDIFEKFEKPNNKKIYDVFGYGGMHNCGPHPCAKSYIDYGDKKLKNIDVSMLITYKHLDSFLPIFKGTETIISFNLGEYNYSPDKSIKFWGDTVEKAVKYNIICVPTWFPIDAKDYNDNEIREIYDSLLEINTEYANSLNLK